MTNEQIVSDLAERIASGEYPAHSKLPSMRELADLYSVSVGTIAEVHRRLKERGLTYGVPGAGVYVEGPDS
ncbi:winged helix-turn-helix domain-containing protein [Micromonospora aurantiaca]|uniref:winged helix-turn-helix domain-containing protein n=1 Tax=Micromonospora aurantiaca (nom. illeg.) TaxID=47850 RepID=UPI0033B53020